MSEMIERVGRAIADALAGQDGMSGPWALTDGKVDWIDQGETDLFTVARAAIEAMFGDAELGDYRLCTYGVDGWVVPQRNR